MNAVETILKVPPPHLLGLTIQLSMFASPSITMNYVRIRSVLSAEWRRQTGEFSVSSVFISFYLHSGYYATMHRRRRSGYFCRVRYDQPPDFAQPPPVIRSVLYSTRLDSFIPLRP